jgi:hypothetical protein
LQDFGALRLYIDFFTTWKIAQAQEILVFSWGWGKLNFRHIEVFERDGKEFCPIIKFDEFYGMLQAAYILY